MGLGGIDATGMLNSADALKATSRNYHLTHDASNAISGFYYDEQLKNEGLTMSLHPSMKYTSPPQFWDYADDLKYANSKYNAIPIVRALVGEDFQIAIANQWDENTILDDATQMFNSVKTLAPYADYFGKEFDKMHEAGKNVATGNTDGDKVGNLLNEGAGWSGAAARKITPYLNRALVVQGSRFAYYNGSSVGFGNMTMKFTLFSDWVDGQWRSCIDKIIGSQGAGPNCTYKLIDYCIGKYVKWDQDTDQDSVLNQFVGWQLPPGGFKPDLKNVDNIQDGTLLLIIGDMYAIPNLVIQDAQFTFSKQVMKKPESVSKIDLVPMYCDVQLTLKPASKYTDVTFSQSLDGSFISDRKEKFIKNINDRLKSN